MKEVPFRSLFLFFVYSGPNMLCFEISVLLLSCVAQEVVDWTVFHSDFGRFSIRGDYPKTDRPEVGVQREQ